MQCNPVFCLGTKHEPLNPVLHFNHKGLLMFLELFHLVNCFEFHVRLGFAGIKGGYAESASGKLYRSWIRIMSYSKFTHFSFKSTLTSMISEYFHMRRQPWVSFMWPVSTWPFSALILRAMLCTVSQQMLTKANLWFSANPMCHLWMLVGLCLSLSESHSANARKIIPCFWHLMDTPSFDAEKFTLPKAG